MTNKANNFKRRRLKRKPQVSLPFLEEKDFDLVRRADTIEDGKEIFFKCFKRKKSNAGHFKKFLNILLDKKLNEDLDAVLELIGDQK